MTDPDPLRVLSIPADHPYVRHTLPVERPAGRPRVELLPDPTTPWWPHLGLDPRWVREHRASFDLIHVHFGFEQTPLAQLRAWCAATAELGVAVVVTVHDLRNPHLDDNALHEQQLAILLRRADAVITLTNGAADEIWRHHRRRALVLAHPHLASDAALGRAVGTRERRVGVFYGSGRANVIRAASIVPRLGSTCAAQDATLRVHVQSSARPELITELRALREGVDFELHVAPRSSDEALWAELATLHAVVLPYRFGTHSGWIELCRDVGTLVVAPDCGSFVDQWDEVVTYALDGCGLPAVGSLEAAVERALRTPPPDPADRTWRVEQREAVAEAHHAVYNTLVRRDDATGTAVVSAIAAASTGEIAR